MKSSVFVPDSSIKVTPIGSISTSSNMRPDRDGWRVPVPKEFESDPTITITLTSDPDGILLSEVVVHGNVQNYIVQVQHPRTIGFVSAGTFTNGKTSYKASTLAKVTKVRLILKTVKPLDINKYPTEYLVKVSVIACFLPGKPFFFFDFIHLFIRR